MDDHELLQEYVQRQSEAAFAELVGRHVNLVYSAALRLAGERALAQDVAQVVFLQLARKAGTVRNGRALGSWLYRVTHAVTVDVLRSEHRRRVREREAMNRAEQNADAPGAWASVGPLLDEAMRRLKPAEMDAVVLRFFEGKSLREVGDALELSEDGAQKRVGRALEKMRAYLARRGVTATAAALTAVIATNSVQAAPAGLAEKVTGRALAGVGGGGGILGGFFAAHTKLATGLTVAALAVASLPVISQVQENVRLRAEVGQAQQRNDQLYGRKTAGGRGERATRGAGAESLDAEIAAQIQKAVKMKFAGAIDFNNGDGNGFWQTSNAGSFAQGWGDFIGGVDAAQMPRVLTQVEQVKARDTRSELRELTLSAWAKNDPAAAMAYAESKTESTDGVYTNGGPQAVMREWAKKDLPAAEAYVERQPAGAARDAFLEAIALAAAPTDPQAAWDFVSRLSSGSTDARPAYESIYDHWPTADFARVAEAVAALSMPARETAMTGLGQAWAKSDPTAAMAWAEHLNDPQMSADNNQQARDSSVRAVLAGWASADLNAAFDWVAQLQDAAKRKDAYQVIMRNLDGTNIKAAQAYLEAMPAGEERDELQQIVATNLASTDQEAALKAIAEMPDGEARDKAMLGLVRSWAQYCLPRPQEQAGMLDIAAWVQTFSGATLRADGYRAIMEKWVKADAGAAEVWLGTLPAGVERDGATYLFTVDYGNEHNFPAQMAPWIETMGKGRYRSIALNNTAIDWLELDREAATVWISRSKLFSDKDREKFLGSSGGSEK
jgi:RNA polymerase sigma factor (sigma-70 family)